MLSPVALPSFRLRMNSKAELERVKVALALNGYPKWAFDRARYRPPPPLSTEDADNSTSTPIAPLLPSSSSSSSSKPRLGNVTLPYFSGVTEPLMRVLNAKGISTSIKSRGSLREILVKPKDQLEKEKTTGLIYHIPCAGANSIPCPGTYVGETERTVSNRFHGVW